jgi:SAM-dependent methyltransferase
MASGYSPDHEQIRAAVTARYSGLARAAHAGQQITDCDPGPFAAGRFGAAGYADTSELPDGAVRASLGCGNPVAVAALHPGETVLDLGSGGGIDVLLSARRVPPGGTAYGLDGSPDMIALARENAAQAGVTNAEFLHGHIEDIPLPDGHVDVVISNCVINLSADKPRVLAETFRVLRPGGRLGISDVIADDALDPARRVDAEQRTGCTTGTLTAGDYRSLLLASGFTIIQITTTQDAEPGLRSAIIQAARCASRHPGPAQERARQVRRSPTATTTARATSPSSNAAVPALEPDPPAPCQKGPAHPTSVEPVLRTSDLARYWNRGVELREELRGLNR